MEIIRSPVFWSLTRQPVRIHDFQFSVDLSPVPDWDSPLLGDLKCSQIQSLHESLRTREYASLAIEPSEGRIQAFNGVCCIESLSDICRKLENRCDHIPVFVPAFHGRRIRRRPCLRSSHIYRLFSQSRSLTMFVYT